MAITTDNGKLSVMEWCSIWEPGLPISPGTIDQADQQQFLWGFSEILWAAPATTTMGGCEITIAATYGIETSIAATYGIETTIEGDG